MAPTISFGATVLDALDPPALGQFYQRLLGWELGMDSAGWVTLHPPGGGTGLAIQAEPHHVAPVWPAEAQAPPMQLHLDLRVDDLAAACSHAEECGATLAAFQPQDHVRVYIDPAGHPFCLYTE